MTRAAAEANDLAASTNDPKPASKVRLRDRKVVANVPPLVRGARLR